MLILDHLANRQMGFPSDLEKCIDVRKCIQILHLYEARSECKYFIAILLIISRWHVAGRMCDLLNYLLTIGESSSNNSTPHHNPLERRYEDNVETSQLEVAKKPALGEDGQPLSVPDIDQLFTLPFHTDELSRSPLHGLLDDLSQEVWKERTSQYALPRDLRYSSLGHISSSISNNGQEFVMLETGTVHPLRTLTDGLQTLRNASLNGPESL